MKKIINKLLTLNLKSAHNLDGVTVAGKSPRSQRA